MKAYYVLHGQLPKPFRFSVGEKILAETASCLRLVVLANAVDKKALAGRAAGAEFIKEMRAGVEVIRGFILLAWHMKFLSHGALADLSSRLESISKQAARWQQWFAGEAAK